MSRSSEIAANAESYLGQTEKSGNSGFTDPEFEAEMTEEGWKKSWAWCAVFAKVVFKNIFPEKSEELNKLFSPGTVQTFRNFRDAGYPVSLVPSTGALVIWQTMKDGKPQTTGHAGIVVSVVDQHMFYSVEGNTNDGGGREGYIVAKKQRKVVANVKDGLKILGFIQIA